MFEPIEVLPPNHPLANGVLRQPLDQAQVLAGGLLRDGRELIADLRDVAGQLKGFKVAIKDAFKDLIVGAEIHGAIIGGLAVAVIACLIWIWKKGK